MNRLEGNIRVKGGIIKYLDNFMEILDHLKKDNEGKYGRIIIEMAEKDIQYHRHKYYRSYLLPGIADEAFDGNKKKAHIEMKRMFLYHPVTSVEDIPDKHIGRCIIDVERDIQPDGSMKYREVGYMPSMGDISDKEAREFIMKVENFAFNTLQVAIMKENQEAMYHRNKSLGLEVGDGEKGMSNVSPSEIY